MSDNGSIEKLRERIQTYKQAIALFENTREALLARRRNATDGVKVHIDSSLATHERALKSLRHVLETAKAEVSHASSLNQVSASPLTDHRSLTMNGSDRPLAPPSSPG